MAVLFVPLFFRLPTHDRKAARQGDPSTTAASRET
jgi:hypothetical protein